MSELFSEPLTDITLPEVKHFFCGDAEWERETADWLTGTDTTEPRLPSLLQMGQTEAWLYRNEFGELVGYAVLTKLQWKKDSKRIKTTLLQSVAIQKQFQGKPDGDGEIKYSHQIMADLAQKAIDYGRPLWGLLVHKDNVKAQRLYESVGFVKIDEPRNTHFRMFIDLSDEIRKSPRDAE